MARIQQAITMKAKRAKVLHRSVGKPFAIQIDRINGAAADSIGPDAATFLHRMVGGVVPSLEAPTLFLSMTGAQCLPVGSIRGRLRENIGLNEALVNYTVLTEGDA